MQDKLVHEERMRRLAIKRATRKHQRKRTMQLQKLKIRAKSKLNLPSEASCKLTFISDGMLNNCLEGKTSTRFFKKHLLPLSEMDIEKIAKNNDKLLSWLGAKTERAVRFFWNPVKELEKSGIITDSVLMSKIRALYSKASGRPLLKTSMKMDSITIDVDSENSTKLKRPGLKKGKLRIKKNIPYLRLDKKRDVR